MTKSLNEMQSLHIGNFRTESGKTEIYYLLETGDILRELNQGESREVISGRSETGETAYHFLVNGGQYAPELDRIEAEMKSLLARKAQIQDAIEYAKERVANFKKGA